MLVHAALHASHITTETLPMGAHKPSSGAVHNAPLRHSKSLFASWKDWETGTSKYWPWNKLNMVATGT
eukprot:5131820-Lingulodinium_polyedra.AAC.1